MRRTTWLAVVIAMTALVAGCIDVDTLVTVNSDGSGTIQETMRMNKAAVQQMKAMMASMAGPEGTTEVPALFDETKLQSKAAEYGEGVTYLSGEPLATDTSEGFKAVYAFSDINKVKLNQNPGDKFPASGAPPPEQEYINFQFTSGSPNRLIIKRPEPDSSAAPDGPPGAAPGADSEPGEADPQAMAMMQQMLKDMKIRIAIKVEGAITETNAMHQQGSEVTLIEMDFNAVLSDPEKFKKMTILQSQRLEEMKEIMKDLPGMKVDLNDEVRILFN